MSKEEDGKFLKIQACVLKVNICCEGCQKKVKKVLHKIDGVYTTAIDAEERKVIVTGNVDPAILIKKLGKVGKRAELWPTKGGNQQNLANQLQKLQFEQAKGQQKENGKTKKGGGGGGGGGKDVKWEQPQPQQQQAKGFKDLKFPSLKDLKLPFKKESKTVKFDLPPEEEIDDEGDYSDDYDEFDDEDLDDMDGFDDEDIYDDPKMMKPMSFQPIANGTGKDKKGNGHGGGGGKGGEVQVPNKAVGGSNINGGGGKAGGGGGGKNGDGAHDSKNGGGNKNKGGNGTAGNFANHGNPSHGDNKGGGGGGGGGGSNNGAGGGGLPMGQPNMMAPMGHTQTAMGHMGSVPAVRGLPVGDGPPPGYFQGGMVPPEMMMAGAANPYQQQYLQALMQQQQRMMMMNGQDRPPAFPPMGYGYGYGRPAYAPPPPPHGEPCTIFSDENPNGCSVM